MGTYLPPYIDDRTDETGHQSGQYHASHKQGGIELHKEHQTGYIACDGDEIRHVAMFSMAELPMCPFVDTPEQVDGDARNDDGE